MALAAAPDAGAWLQEAAFLNVSEALISGEAAPGDEQQVVAAWGGGCAGGRIGDHSQTCASSANIGCAGCALYHACRGRSVCVVNGYLVIPGAPLRGMEDINGGSAGRWDYLWSVARSQCGGEHCVLISNPAGFRTQHQMHLHYRAYNGGGAAMKRRLEQTLCGSSGWRHFSQCGGGKARLFDGMPGVFSAVAGAYGGRGLANIGITVWFTRACGGGQKTMVLATAGCSIEHSISAR